MGLSKSALFCINIVLILHLITNEDALILGKFRCQPQCCPDGLPHNTPLECARPTYSNTTGVDCPGCPKHEYPTCKQRRCPFPPPPCPAPPPNMTITTQYCVADGGIFCYFCFVSTTTCSKGLYIAGPCSDYY